MLRTSACGRPLLPCPVPAHVLHRSGNVHDSKGAAECITQCVARVRERLPRVNIELRMDSAFFSDAIIMKGAAVRRTSLAT
jgi:hypothetical protein